MHHELQAFASIEDLATHAASFIETCAHRAIARSGRFTLALSGGTTPWVMLSNLAERDIDWPRVTIFQVDERVAGAHDAARNLIHIRDCLARVHPKIEAMPVNASNLDTAANEYAASIPRHFDLVHLGLGPDGHTASLIPGDPVLKEKKRLVALTGTYEGRERMTLTYGALARAHQLLWLVAGPDKAEALASLLDGDPSIPATHVRATRSLIMADEAAAASLSTNHAHEAGRTMPADIDPAHGSHEVSP